VSNEPTLHDLAVHFGSAADAYERGRPEHPAEVVALIREELGLEDDARVLDLGAGTGKLTKGLADAGFDVTAVEPLAGMREVLAQRAPGATVLEGFAERIPLEDGSVDAVTVADAFHWFDPQPALAEIRRVLRPGGGHASLNAFPDWSEFAAGGAIAEWITETRPEHPFFDGPSWTDRVRAAPGWGEPREVSVTIARPTSAEGIVAYLASISFVAGMPADERAAWLAHVAELLEGEEIPAEVPFSFRLGIVLRDD
jgi:SAM-dependent methyltransferase